MTQDKNDISAAVRRRYAAAANRVLAEEPRSGCCGPSCCGEDAASDAPRGDAISDDLYADAELGEVPLKAALASLGCGNPTAVAELRPGEVVLDLGSGGGIDVLLSARRVGPTGFAYGLDMTDEMLDLARRNAAEAGAANVAFLKGDIAAIPLPDQSVDVIISNCVIKLAADKAPVLAEAYRVLKPGGRFAVSDIVIHGGLPAELGDGTAFRRDLSAWAGCIAGALTDQEYVRGLEQAGFQDVTLEISRRYGLEDIAGLEPAWVAAIGEELAADIAGRFAATTVRAQRPDQG
jgi:ubiquinone/menaquinone biosynthesis C-methylase UbiE